MCLWNSVRPTTEPGDFMSHASQVVQRRRYPRRRVEAAVAVCGVASSLARMWRGHALNLSEGGAGIIVGGSWLPGQVVRMELAFGDRPEPMQVTARIAHRNRLYCGLEFLATGDQAVSELRQVLKS